MRLHAVELNRFRVCDRRLPRQAAGIWGSGCVVLCVCVCVGACE